MPDDSNPILHTPPAERVARSNLTAFSRRVHGVELPYADLWRWSIDQPADFWSAVWDTSEVIAGRRFRQAMGEPRMPGTEWFSGATLNYAENLLRGDPTRLAVVSAGEGRPDRAVTTGELSRLVAAFQQGLVARGVRAGDRVGGFVPNCLEALVAMLATTALGAVWSSTSPDFGAQGVVDRFGQIEPRVLVVADGYTYNGRTHPLQEKVADIVAAIPTVEHLVVIDFVGRGLEVDGVATAGFADLVTEGPDHPSFEQVPPDHPLFIMYSSGTTGAPKSIVHGHGGTLVKHLCEHRLHCDLKPGSSVLFWFTTCGWMMWNWMVSALASEATVVLYDGSPTAPDATALWGLVERAGVTHFGTSPKYLATCDTLGVTPRDAADLSRLEWLLSTGAPLNPDQFDWVYGHVDRDVHLASVSGGTDLIGCFAAGVPTEPVRRGELQGRALGMAVEAWDEEGNPVIGEKGELVCTRPFPSMPIGFWGDPDGSRYHDAYFAEHPGVWTHGDYIEIRPEGGVIIHGRSDTTLNPGGVRIGTAEIYRAIEGMAELVDSIVVGRERDGDVEVVLCVQLAAHVELDDELASRIRQRIRSATTPRHVPTWIKAVPAIPYTLSGKKVEKAVRHTIAGRPVDNRDALQNPEALDRFADLEFD